ncbi:hypothetical protein HYALB_00005434 [Hymenoscyphus albidus]|uniref:Rhodopsin domain-containing protein n=1 Tax=Hymenoscyphus albidus TaxID=595503 RepID=A0A9N9LD34_9HELO|nr:hypothetical protein HYALB_00005434 [Hymenoscyphus albidus]
MDSFPPAEAAYEMAHLSDNRGYQQTVPIAIFGVFAFLCVLLRPVARRSTGIPLGLDDWLIIVSMVFAIALVVATCMTTKFGVGRHLLAVIMDNPGDLVNFGKVNFALQVAYPGTLGFAKLSILALYVRIFRVAGDPFMFAVWATATWIILWMIGVYLVVLLGCMPLHTYWTATCRPTYPTSVTTGVLNIVSDIAVLVLPQAQVWGLQMPMRRRAGLSVIFLLGVLATVMSIARIPILKMGNAGGSVDITYNLIRTYVFTVLEPMIAIICACLPVLQGLFVKGYTTGFGFSSIWSLLQIKTTKTQDSKDSWRKISKEGTNATQWQKTTSQKSLQQDQNSMERGEYELGNMSAISARAN